MLPNKPEISLIIVSWNNIVHLLSCLHALSIQTYKDFEVVVVDNGSTDSFIKHIQQFKLNVVFEQLQKNHGFAVANNTGARLARGKWLVLLNADAFPEPDWLEKLFNASESHPKIACFSSRQIKANNPEYLDGTGDAYHVSGMAWRIGLGYPTRSYGLNSTSLFSPCAAAAMYLREAFLEVGGFDEDFFSYFEDVDLGFRLQLKGYRSMYVPDAVVHHVGSATFGVRSDFAFYHSHRNMVWTYFKNMPSFMFWRYLPAHLIANFIYVLYYTFQGRGKILWKAKWDAIKGLPRALKKRRNIQNTRRISNKDLLGSMQRGWLLPYLLGYHLRRALKNSQMDK